LCFSYIERKNGRLVCRIRKNSVGTREIACESRNQWKARTRKRCLRSRRPGKSAPGIPKQRRLIPSNSDQATNLTPNLFHHWTWPGCLQPPIVWLARLRHVNARSLDRTPAWGPCAGLRTICCWEIPTWPRNLNARTQSEWRAVMAAKLTECRPHRAHAIFWTPMHCRRLPIGLRDQ